MSFARFARSQPGAIAIAVKPVHGGPALMHGDDAPAHAWSTSKPLVLAALLKATSTSGGLSAKQHRLATAAITVSDNQAIIYLFDDLAALTGGPRAAARAMEELLRRSGDHQTTVATSTEIPPGASTTFGQTLWAPSESVKFFAALAGRRLLGAADTGYLLGLMRRIAPSDSWGLGSAGFGSLAFKGGWGPEDGNEERQLVRQSGIIDSGGDSGGDAGDDSDNSIDPGDIAAALAVSIVARPPASAESFTIGTEMVTAAARWLAAEIRVEG